MLYQCVHPRSIFFGRPELLPAGRFYARDKGFMLGGETVALIGGFAPRRKTRAGEKQR